MEISELIKQLQRERDSLKRNGGRKRNRKEIKALNHEIQRLAKVRNSQDPSREQLIKLTEDLGI